MRGLRLKPMEPPLMEEDIPPQFYPGFQDERNDTRPWRLWVNCHGHTIVQLIIFTFLNWNTTYHKRFLIAATRAQRSSDLLSL